MKPLTKKDYGNIGYSERKVLSAKEWLKNAVSKEWLKKYSLLEINSILELINEAFNIEDEEE